MHKDASLIILIFISIDLWIEIKTIVTKRFSPLLGKHRMLGQEKPEEREKWEAGQALSVSTYTSISVDKG